MRAMLSGLAATRSLRPSAANCAAKAGDMGPNFISRLLQLIRSMSTRAICCSRSSMDRLRGLRFS